MRGHGHDLADVRRARALSGLPMRMRTLSCAIALAWTVGGGIARATCADPQVIAGDDSRPWKTVAFSIDVLSNDQDEGGQELFVAANPVGASHGTAAMSADGKSVLYTPKDNAGFDSFTYTATVADGSRSASASVSLVTPPPAGCDPATTCGDFTVNCDPNHFCRFDVQPAVAQGVQSMTWNFGDPQAPANGPATVANILTTGAIIVFHQYPVAPFTGTVYPAVTITYYSGVVKTVSKPLALTNDRPLGAWHFRTLNGLRTVASIDTWPQNTSQYAYILTFNFGDGTAPQYVDPMLNTDSSHAFSGPGHFKPELDIEQDSCTSFPCTRVAMYRYPQDIDILNNPPNADFTEKSTDGVAWTFDANATTDEYPNTIPQGMTSFGWGFGDGSYATGSFDGNHAPVPVTHSFPGKGTYNVTLQVTDGFGATGTVTKPVVYQNKAPNAFFTFSCNGLYCSYDASGSTDDGTILKYTWNFGDSLVNYTTTNRSVVKQYPNWGPYKVTLTVNDGAIDSSPARRVVTLAPFTSAAGLNFYSVTPCRLFDSGSLAMPSGKPYTINTVPSCDVPSNASSLAVTVRAFNQTGAGSIKVFPTNTYPYTPLSSVVSFEPSNGPRASNTILPLGPYGQISMLPVTNSSSDPAFTTGIRIDVTGFFSSQPMPAPFNSARGPWLFSPLAPCRVIDSRGTNTPLLAGNVSYVKIRPLCGVSPYAFAMALNVHIAAATAPGYAYAYSSNLTTPPVPALINFNASVVQANATLVSTLGRATDDLALLYGPTAGSWAHYALDTTGYFSGDSVNAYYPIMPCRIADTRDPAYGMSPVGGKAQSVIIQGNCGIPPGAVAVSLVATAITPGGSGNLLVCPTGQCSGSATTLDFESGEKAISNGEVVPLSGSVPDLSVISTISGTGQTDFTLDAVGYFLKPSLAPSPQANARVEGLELVPPDSESGVTSDDAPPGSWEEPEDDSGGDPPPDSVTRSGSESAEISSREGRTK